MSRASSISAKQTYTMTRVCRVWGVARSTVYHQLSQFDSSEQKEKQRPGPQGACTDSKLKDHIQSVIEESNFYGEGYRKIWAKLRFKGIRTSPRRVLRVMRENGLLAHKRTSMHPGPKTHNGSIIPDDQNEMWGTDMTKAHTIKDGWVSVFGVVDHFVADCLGLHAAKPGNRFEALEPIRQSVKDVYGGFAQDVALGLTMRHDCGSQYTSDDFQDELDFLGIKSSPAYVRSPECNGCIERFFRTLKENLLWIQEFEDIDHLNQALQEFKHLYNTQWLIARHNYKTPSQVRERRLASFNEAA